VFIRENLNLEPQRSPEKVAIGMVPNLNGKLPPDRAGERVSSEISHAARCLISGIRDAVEFKAEFIPQELIAVARVEEIFGH
jgi:hypothetical protein